MDMVALMTNISVSLLTGFASGLCSSIIVTRLSRFESLRSEAQRVLRSLNYFRADNGGTDIVGDKPNTQILIHISSDFLALGHAEAGQAVMRLSSEMDKTIRHPPVYTETTRLDAEWQRIGRTLKPSLKSIFHFGFKA
jgi:hypothetical protein